MAIRVTGAFMGLVPLPAAGRWFLCRFGISGLSAWSGWICCPDAEYRWAFLRRGSSCGGCKLTRLWMRCLVDVRGLVGLSGPGRRMCSPCWAAGVSVRDLRPYQIRAIAVVAPEVPNVDPSTSPTQITCLYTFSVLKLVCVILGMDMGGRMVLIICYYYSSSNMMIRIWMPLSAWILYL